MIPGIEVLAQEVISGPNDGLIALGFVFTILFIVGSIFLLALSFIDDVPLLAGIATLCLVLAFLIGSETNKEMNKKPYTEYKVLISDEVSWNEFNERYEVINQEGKIYTIKEKVE